MAKKPDGVTKGLFENKEPREQASPNRGEPKPTKRDSNQESSKKDK